MKEKDYVMLKLCLILGGKNKENNTFYTNLLLYFFEISIIIKYLNTISKVISYNLFNFILFFENEVI